LFAMADISVGTLVSRLGGRLVSDGQLDALLRVASADGIGVYVDSIVVGAPSSGATRG
jgi:hypothetical protein